MSLCSFALRLIATRVLKGRTWAGDNVLNAPIEPLGEVLNRVNPSGKPFIGVFTSEVQSKPMGRDTSSRGHMVELTFFVYLPPRMRPLEDTTIEFDHAASAMSLDLVARQIANELRAGASPWKPLWDAFATRFDEHDIKPVLIETDKGVRIACCEIRLQVVTLPEPPVGTPLFGHWLELDTQMRADPDTLPLADMIKDMIEFRDMPSWQSAAAVVAASGPATRSLGIAPFDDTETGEPAELEQIEFSGGDETGTPL